MQATKQHLHHKAIGKPVIFINPFRSIYIHSCVRIKLVVRIQTDSQRVRKYYSRDNVEKKKKSIVVVLSLCLRHRHFDQQHTYRAIKREKAINRLALSLSLLVRLFRRNRKLHYFGVRCSRDAVTRSPLVLCFPRRRCCCCCSERDLFLNSSRPLFFFFPLLLYTLSLLLLSGAPVV